MSDKETVPHEEGDNKAAEANKAGDSKVAENPIPEYSGILRNHIVEMPKPIEKCGGIRIFGRVVKSLIFSTDIAIIRNTNADAVLAVYPFTPQPIISHAIINASDLPVFCGVGGGTTTGNRVVRLASDAEFLGAFGVVLNSPTVNSTIKKIAEVVDIPIVITVVSETEDIAARIEAGAAILNVAAGAKTPHVVERVKSWFPETAIIATGGRSEQSIVDTVSAGADAVTWTPPTPGEIFRDMMARYRNQTEKKKSFWRW